jgi:hypothetical protein
MKHDPPLRMTGAALRIFSGANGPVLSGRRLFPTKPPRGAADDRRGLAGEFPSFKKRASSALTGRPAGLPKTETYLSGGKSNLQGTENAP